MVGRRCFIDTAPEAWSKVLLLNSYELVSLEVEFA